MIDANDRGFLLGDGLFETILWENGVFDAFDAHVARLIAGCLTMGLPAPQPAALTGAARAAVEDAGLDDARAAVRLSWTAGSGGRGLDRPETPAPRLVVAAALAPKPNAPARVVVSSVRRNEGSPASRLKSLAYLDNVLARRDARAHGADEALMLNNRGEICGGAAANLFWFEAVDLVTPALDCGVLDGIMRGRVIARARDLGWTVREVRAGLAALNAASGLFLTNSLIGVRGVARLADRAIGADGRLARLMG